MIAVPTFLMRALGSKIALGALLCVGAAIALKIYGETRWRAGYEAYRLEMLEKAAEVERERIKDETRLKDLSDDDLCIDYLGDRGLPVSDCAKLRRLPRE